MFHEITLWACEEKRKRASFKTCWFALGVYLAQSKLLPLAAPPHWWWCSFFVRVCRFRDRNYLAFQHRDDDDDDVSAVHKQTSNRTKQRKHRETTHFCHRQWHTGHTLHGSGAPMFVNMCNKLHFLKTEGKKIEFFPEIPLILCNC